MNLVELPNHDFEMDSLARRLRVSDEHRENVANFFGKCHKIFSNKRYQLIREKDNGNTAITYESPLEYLESMAGVFSRAAEWTMKYSIEEIIRIDERAKIELEKIEAASPNTENRHDKDFMSIKKLGCDFKRKICALILEFL